MDPCTRSRAVLYLRLSDFRVDDKDSFPARERSLREKATALGWDVVDVVVENDATKDGRRKGVSAFKRRKVTLPDGSTAYRVVRPGFQRVISALGSGAANALLAEDLDRTLRDPYDAEDLLAVLQSCKGNARSLSGSLTITDGGTDGEKTIIRILTAVSNKSSMDTSRRVSAARERQARNGEFGGGKRPYGFLADGVTPQWDEYLIIETCSRRLVQGASLRSLAAELRDAEVPTVTGTPWTAPTLRCVLLRPRNAGLLVYQGEEIGRAPWPAAVPEDVFRAVVRMFTDPSRRKGPGAAPKYLGTGVYLCGACGDGTSVHVTLGGRYARYRCVNRNHLVRSQKHVDNFVLDVVAARLSRPDAVELFARNTASGVDVAALRTESEAIRANLKSLAEDRALNLIDRAQMIAATEKGRTRLAAIDRTLADSAVSSPIAEVVGAHDVRAALEAAPLSLRRLIVAEVAEVTILPTAKRGSGFDPNGVRVELDRALWTPQEAS